MIDTFPSFGLWGHCRDEKFWCQNHPNLLKWNLDYLILLCGKIAEVGNHEFVPI